MQAEVDFLLVLALGSLALVLGFIAFIVWTLSRAARDLVTALSPVQRGETLTVGHIEARLDALDHERFVDVGVVQSVTPERRRPGRWPLALMRDARDGLRVEVAIPTPLGEATTEWFPVPDALTGGSRLERLLAAHDVPHRNVAELLGAEVRIEKRGGDWHLVVPGGSRDPVGRTVERLREWA